MDVVTCQLTVLLTEKSVIIVVIKAILWACKEDLEDNPVTADDNPTPIMTDTKDHMPGQAADDIMETIDIHAYNVPEAAEKEAQHPTTKIA